MRDWLFTDEVSILWPMLSLGGQSKVLHILDEPKEMMKLLYREHKGEQTLSIFK